MGTYLFNFHVKTADRDGLGAALVAVSALPACVSEASGGWTSVYPSKHSSIPFARETSERLGCLAVAFEVYDSDECRCVVYNAGKRVARRIFGGEATSPEQGDPARFAKYATGSVDELREALASHPVYAEETVFVLAKAFGIPRERAAFSHPWAHGDQSLPTGIERFE